MNYEDNLRSEKPQKAGSPLKAFASKSIHKGIECTPSPVSPVDDRIQRLRNQCDNLHDLVAQLIDKARPILNCDPREILDECSAPVSVSSCPLESDLTDLLDRLTHHSNLLSAAIQRIQL